MGKYPRSAKKLKITIEITYTTANAILFNKLSIKIFFLKARLIKPTVKLRSINLNEKNILLKKSNKASE